MVDTTATPQLSHWLSDPQQRNIYQQSIQNIIDISQSQKRAVARELTKHTGGLIATHVPCFTCRGSGHTLDIVAVLHGLPELGHRTPALPGPVPHSDCRWFCPICPGKKPFFSKTSDLRRHFKDLHGFSSEGIKQVFDPRCENNERLWERCGPCTITQARDNGWDFHHWPVGNRRERTRQLFFRALGSAKSVQEWGATFARTVIQTSSATSTNAMYTYGTANSPTVSMSSTSLLDSVQQNLIDWSYTINDPSPQDDVVMQTGAKFDQPRYGLETMSQSTILPDSFHDHQLADMQRMIHVEQEQMPLEGSHMEGNDPFLPSSMYWHGNMPNEHDFRASVASPQPWSPLSRSTDMSD